MLAGLIRKSLGIGPKQYRQAQNWSSTGAVYGAIGATAFVWLTGWKVIMQKIPYIGGGFPDDEEES